MIALAWPVGLGACLAWLAGALTSRMSSMGALVSSLASIPLAWVLGHPQMVLLCALLALLIFWRHRGNIARIKTGTEPKIGQKS